jgi:hypothetical protein
LVPSPYGKLAAGIRDLKVTTDLASEELVDLSMAGNGGTLPGGRIDVDRVIRALAKQAASL